MAIFLNTLRDRLSSILCTVPKHFPSVYEETSAHTPWAWWEVDDQIGILLLSCASTAAARAGFFKAAAALGPAASAVIWRVQRGRGSEEFEEQHFDT